MSDRIAFAIFDAGGLPKTGATPTFVDYCDRDGTPKAQPTITEFGAGLYGFVPTSDDYFEGRAYVIATGSGLLPNWLSGQLGPDRTQFVVVLLEDGSALWTGAAPTLGAYKDLAGNNRTPAPGLLALSGQHLYALMPSAGDIANGTAWRIDLPVGTSVPYFSGSFYLPSSPALPTTTTKRVEQAAAQSLREWLLLQLPAKVAQVNAARYAVLKSAIAEPFTIATGAILQLSFTSKDGPFTPVPLTPGATRTAAQFAADVNAVRPGTCTTDSDGRWVITSLTAPVAGTPSVVSLGAETTSGTNSRFGLDPGGEFIINSALVAPSSKGVADGWPLTPDLGPGFWVIIGDRQSNPKAPGPRTDEYLVALELAILSPAPPGESHRSREPIAACVQCVREVLLTTRGRQFGAPGSTAAAAIVYSEEQGAMVAGRPFRFNTRDAVNPMFDIATMKLVAKVFERPAES